MLEDKLYKDYVEAMKAKNRQKSDFLSFVRAELKNTAINLKKDKLDDAEVLNVIKKQKKQLEEAKETIKDGQREETRQALIKEIAILEEYLPKQLSESELTSVIEQVIKDTGAASMKDMGKVMKEVVAKVGAAADSKKISDIVKAKLTPQSR
ncbi:MAG: GatB/YqeY domain-containing protein [Candidatus Omnitrophota bacterium]